MAADTSQRPTFRFAPSPNGPLHLGHALSAMLNQDMARAAGGRPLLRIEDIDRARCTPEFERGIYDDLAWLGLEWETPVRRQSEHFDQYREALQSLIDRGLVYPSFLTRGEMKARVSADEAAGKSWPRDPEGAPLYPADDRNRSDVGRRHMLDSGMTPDGDRVGGSMVDVVRNTSQLSKADRDAMAVYLKSLPAVEGRAAKKKQ